MDQFDEAKIWIEKALEVGKKTNNLRAVAGALSVQGSFLTDTGKIDEGLSLWQQAYESAVQYEDYVLARTCVFNMSIYTYPRDIAKARELALKALELSKNSNLMLSEARGWWWLSMLDWLQGEWSSAIEKLQKATAITERLGLGVDVTTVEHEAWEGRYALGVGELEKAERLLQESQRLSEKVPKITLLVSVNLASGLLKLEQSKDQEAIAFFEKSVDAFKNWEFTTEPLLHIETLLYLTRLYCKQREFEKAEKAASWAMRLATQLRSDAGLAMAWQSEAYLTDVRGNKKEAEQAFVKAIELWEKAGWPYYKAKTLVDFSESVAQANPEESKKQLQQAAQIFKKLGAKRDYERAEARLSSQA